MSGREMSTVSMTSTFSRLVDGDLPRHGKSRSSLAPAHSAARHLITDSGERELGFSFSSSCRIRAPSGNATSGAAADPARCLAIEEAPGRPPPHRGLARLLIEYRSVGVA